jgi:putative addiction module antidote
MIMQTKVRKIGNSLGIVLPKESLEQLQVKEGQAVYLTRAPDGALRLSPEDPAFAEKAAIVDSLMDRYRNALRELAK